MNGLTVRCPTLWPSRNKTGCERLESNQLPPAYETGGIPFPYAAIKTWRYLGDLNP